MRYAITHHPRKATFGRLYSRLELERTVLMSYTKCLFSWRKGLSASHDGKNLFDFARFTPKNLDRLHRALSNEQFTFRPGLERSLSFNKKHRKIYIFPWEERLVDLLLYRLLTRYFHSSFSPFSYAYRYRSFGVDACQRKLASYLKSASGPLYFFKRDVKDYFPSIDHTILIEQLRSWIGESDYLFKLLRERVNFSYVLEGEDGVEQIPIQSHQGIPFGSAISCFFANLYLHPLDCEVGSIPDLAYFRYADDILACSPSRSNALEAISRCSSVFSELYLQSKSSHHRNFAFLNPATMDPLFEPVAGFRHLGLEFRANRLVAISRDKVRKIRNLYKRGLLKLGKKLRYNHSPEARAEAAIAAAHRLTKRAFRSVAIIDYYLKHTEDERQLQHLDRWLAEEVLSFSFQNGHKRGNFRRLPFSKMRTMGLPSLLHRRRLLLHGHIDSSFFTFRNMWLTEGRRRRLQGGKPAQ